MMESMLEQSLVLFANIDLSCMLLFDLLSTLAIIYDPTCKSLCINWK